ncbi:MAG: anaerobic ribonucleoside-triphosphate reductase activating protein [Clostridia bacterium]|nr:anaerobic ribonucleoside-triphosphate reductase activating protein [Clostridia bacterium]
MNYATVKWCDIANGEGVRISLFVSGCTHRCKNCFNEIAWDFAYGEVFDEKIQAKILSELGAGYIAGLSLLGGEPLEPENQKALLPFVREVKKRYPQKTIWCYTGFVFDEQTGELTATHKNTPDTKELISLFDILVDGPFVEELKDIRLKFRGSSNQRVIDVQKTLKEKKCVLYLD